MFKVIIIDDEPLARRVIREYLGDNSDMEIVAECANGFEGLKSISQHLPDLVFLDIHMPKITGFEMLELIDNPPGIIFTTAFDEYAIKAFESNAIDYLLKPFSKERFATALQRWRQRHNSGSDGRKIQEFASRISAADPAVNRVIVKDGNNIRILSPDEISFVEAYDDYVKINITGDCFLKKQTMQQMENLLGEKNFLRVHRSFLVRLNNITRVELIGKESYVAVLTDNTRIPLSKPGYARLKQVLGI